MASQHAQMLVGEELSTFQGVTREIPAVLNETGLESDTMHCIVEAAETSAPRSAPHSPSCQKSPGSKNKRSMGTRRGTGERKGSWDVRASFGGSWRGQTLGKAAWAP